MARKGWWAAAFVVLVALPPADAAQAEGSFAIAGEIQVPQGASFEGVPLALLRWTLEGGDPLGLDDFQVRARVVRVHRYHAEAVSANAPLVPHDGVSVPMPSSKTTYTLHNVTVTLLAERASAYVAVDPRPGDAFSFHATRDAATVAARNETHLSSSGQPQADDGTDVHYYHRALAHEHLLLTGPGRVHHEGAATVKLFGVDVHLQADENATRIHTGEGAPADLGVGPKGWDWAVLEAEDVILDASSRGPWEMAADGGALRWEGKAVFRCLQGEMRSDGDRYLADPRPVTLEGAFEGTIRPEGQGRAVHARLDLVGDLSTTSMAAASDGVAARPGPAPLLPWLGVGLGVAVAATGMGGALAWRRRARRTPAATAGPTAEECVRKADEHIQLGQFEAALPWIVQARRLAPTSALACATHGFLLGELGRLDDALAAYREASRLAPDEAEYALDAARLAHAAGRPPEQVEDLLELALARAPAQVEELERDGFFDDLASRPRYEHMVERAWRRHVGDLSGPGGDA